jgi:hypothetical protein
VQSAAPAMRRARVEALVAVAETSAALMAAAANAGAPCAALVHAAGAMLAWTTFVVVAPQFFERPVRLPALLLWGVAAVHVGTALGLAALSATPRAQRHTASCAVQAVAAACVHVPIAATLWGRDPIAARGGTYRDWLVTAAATRFIYFYADAEARVAAACYGGFLPHAAALWLAFAAGQAGAFGRLAGRLHPATCAAAAVVVAAAARYVSFKLWWVSAALVGDALRRLEGAGW